MRKPVPREGTFMALAVAAALACADVPTHPNANRVLAPGSYPSLNVVTVGGQEYYADGGSGELVPTAVWPASIVNQTSNASIM